MFKTTQCIKKRIDFTILNFNYNLNKNLIAILVALKYTLKLSPLLYTLHWTIESIIYLVLNPHS